MEPRGKAVQLVVKRHILEQSPSGEIFEDDLAVRAGVGPTALPWIVAALAIIVVGGAFLLVLFWAVVQREDVPRAGAGLPEEPASSEPASPEPTPTSEPLSSPPAADPVAIARDLPAPELILLSPQPLRVGDAVEIRVSHTSGWVEYRTAWTPWSRLDGDVLRLTATGDPLRVEVRACDDGVVSPQAIWSWQIRPRNRRPVLSVAHSPETPRAGDSLVLAVSGSDPDGDRVVLEYQVGEGSPWVPAPLGQVMLGDLPAGPYVVSVRAVDEFGLSAVTARRWEILPRRNRSPELQLAGALPRELWVGDHLHVAAYCTDPDGDTA